MSLFVRTRNDYTPLLTLPCSVFRRDFVSLSHLTLVPHSRKRNVSLLNRIVVTRVSAVFTELFDSSVLPDV